MGAMMTPQPTDEIKNHGLVAKVFHWGFIVVFAYALTKQLDNVGQLSDRDLLRFEVIFAIAFLALLGIRYAFMRATKPTALPLSAPWLKRLLARAGHLAMYVSLALIAVSGLLIGALYSAGGPEAPGMAVAVGLHEVSVLATYVSIAVHIAAAVFHRFKGDGIWSAMVPVWKEPKA